MMFFSSKPCLRTLVVAFALYFADHKVNALPAGTASSTSGFGALEQPAPTLSKYGNTCPYMDRKDWNLINAFDTGKLTLQSSNVWKASDWHGIVKWSVFATNLNSLLMSASKDLRGPDNVISVILEYGGTQKLHEDYRWYISAGQTCTNQFVPEYADALGKGAKIVGVTHFQRGKVAPKPLKGGPGPTNKGGDDHPGK